MNLQHLLALLGQQVPATKQAPKQGAPTSLNLQGLHLLQMAGLNGVGGGAYQDGSGVNLGQPQLNVGTGNPQAGFGMQVQNVGGMPNSLQGLPGFQNTRQLQRPTFNPQVKDNGYFWF